MKKPAPIIIRPAAPTPTPIPTLAPVSKPLVAEVEREAVAVDADSPVDVGVVVGVVFVVGVRKTELGAALWVRLALVVVEVVLLEPELSVSALVMLK